MLYPGGDGERGINAAGDSSSRGGQEVVTAVPISHFLPRWHTPTRVSSTGDQIDIVPRPLPASAPHSVWPG